MGRTGTRIGAGLAATLLAAAGVAALAAGAGARTPKPKSPRIEQIKASASQKRATISVKLNPEKLETSYQVALLYRPADCCTPGTKECCPPEVEVVSNGTIPGSSNAHEVHDSAKLREGNYAVRVRVEASNSLGNAEKSRKLPAARA
ncbi:MAG TPA: hypothetical protein VMB91_07725 [Solirubrobacteraceae bacterium]|nr:hypothetical protein [Solirubrobacteraceae bacterium]